ncbi:MAG: head GIN domain-containing protein [Bacteroidota bacterium]
MRHLKCVSLCALAALAITTSSCELDDIFADGEGPTITKELTIGTFTGINLDISADVFITQGDSLQVSAEGQENIINLLELDIANDIWDIEYDGTRIGRHNGLKIFITLPEITELTIDGSGEIISENVLEAEELALAIDGSGDMDLALNVSDLFAEVDGSGSMTLEGVAENIDVKIKGSGDVKGFDLSTTRADVEIRGSGDVELMVSDFIRVEIDGSGSVFFRGDAELDETINGSGEVVRIN